MNEETPGLAILLTRAGSQTAIAKQLGISSSAVQQWYAKGYVPFARALQLEKLYNVHYSRMIKPLKTRKKESK